LGPALRKKKGTMERQASPMTEEERGPRKKMQATRRIGGVGKEKRGGRKHRFPEKGGEKNPTDLTA